MFYCAFFLSFCIHSVCLCLFNYVWQLATKCYTIEAQLENHLQFTYLYRKRNRKAITTTTTKKSKQKKERKKKHAMETIKFNRIYGLTALELLYPSFIYHNHSLCVTGTDFQSSYKIHIK